MGRSPYNDRQPAPALARGSIHLPNTNTTSPTTPPKRHQASSENTYNEGDELLEDRQKLPLPEIKSHIKELKQAQTNLRKLLKKFGARQCTEEWGLELPADVYEVAEIEVRVHVVIEPAP
jgi:hypothetical protein